MHRRLLLLSGCAALVAGCDPIQSPRVGPDGQPLPQRYRIGAGDTSKVQFRMLDSVNALRQAAGLQALQLNAQLNAAAATHSRDMSVQNRPWHFGSDGSSPLDRVQRAGYRGSLLGENISETFETEVQTLAAWMQQKASRDVIMDSRATDMGFSWFQESNGKIWWTMVVGAADSSLFSTSQPAPVADTAPPTAAAVAPAAPTPTPSGAQVAVANTVAPQDVNF